MYATVRRYKGQPGIGDQIASRSKDVEKEIRKAPGFIAYYLIKTSDGAASITICENQAGAEASNRLAADWIKQNMPKLATSPPEISAGNVVINFSTQTTKTHV